MEIAAAGLPSSLESPELDYGSMDCVETNAAAQLRLLSPVEVHRVLGSQWHFEFDETRGVAGLVLDRISLTGQIRALAGLELQTLRLDGDPIARIAELVERRGPALVYADAYMLPWLPLHGNEHLEHTFLVLGADLSRGAVRILDTYTNRTPYGQCSPVMAEVGVEVVAAAIDALRTDRSREALVFADRPKAPMRGARALIADNLQALLDELRERDAIRRFSTYYEQRPEHDDFALACWLVARKRALHHRWLAELNGDDQRLLPDGFADAFEERVVQGWSRAASFAYVGARRARAGRARPGPVYQLVSETLHEAELELAEGLERARMELAA